MLLATKPLRDIVIARLATCVATKLRDSVTVPLRSWKTWLFARNENRNTSIKICNNKNTWHFPDGVTTL